MRNLNMKIFPILIAALSTASALTIPQRIATIKSTPDLVARGFTEDKNLSTGALAAKINAYLEWSSGRQAAEKAAGVDPMKINAADMRKNYEEFSKEYDPKPDGNNDEVKEGVIGS